MSNDQTFANENPIRPYLSDKSYNAVKWLVQTALPLAGSLYFGLAQTWDMPGSEQVVGTLALVATFFGAILGISAKRYNASGAQYDGEMTIERLDDGQKRFTLSVDEDPNELTDRNSVTFKIQNQ